MKYSAFLIIAFIALLDCKWGGSVMNPPSEEIAKDSDKSKKGIP